MLGAWPRPGAAGWPPIVRRVQKLVGIFKRARVQLPARLSLLLGMAAYLPKLLTSAQTRRHFREEAAIAAAVGSGRGIRRDGEGLSERVIEVPWVIRNLPNGHPRVLDTGSANAPLAYQRLLCRLDADVHGTDLVPFELPGIASTVADLRQLPFPDAAFDVALCISTLEHVGMDNQVYFKSGGHPVDEQGDLTALRELGRVTKPGGRVLVTVPGGRDGSFGWHRQYSAEAFTRLAERAGFSDVRLHLFAHDPGVGWRAVPPEDLHRRSYRSGAVEAAGLICASLTP
jgi:SAM-dependent methyltransferase